MVLPQRAFFVGRECNIRNTWNTMNVFSWCLREDDMASVDVLDA